MLMDIAREIEDSSEITSCFFLLKQSYTTPPQKKNTNKRQQYNMHYALVSVSFIYVYIHVLSMARSRFFRWGMVRGSYINFFCMGVGWGDIIGLFLVNFNFTCLLS